MAEQHYAFQERLLRVHQARRCPQKAPKAGQLEITDAWCILRHTDPLLARTAADLQDYFSVSMELDLPLCETAPAARFISYEIDPALGKAGAYRVDASPRGIRLIGTDARAAAQASFLLEDLLNLEEAPFLAPGITDREPIFRCRMVHSGYAEDEYPNEHLNAIAHSGINAILVFVKGVNETLSHREDFNDLIARASSYGLDVYAYSCMTSRLHPDDPEAPAFYDGLYGELFRRCPGFKGVIFVGESVEFPSKDPHTSGMLRLDNIGPDGKRLVNKPNPGWFPCFDYPQWLELVKSSIRRVKPEADIVFWTYNWGYCDEADRLALIEALPTDISLQVTFEMFEDGMRMGIPTRAVDYTLTFPHPGKYFLSEAKAAARRGIPLYAMTNAGGLTWDVGVVPYEPIPYHWLQRFADMRACHEAYGLCGSMDSHHYGFTPSLISELAKACFTTPHPDAEAILDRLLIRDWSAEALPQVKEAFQLFSEAFDSLVMKNRDQYGPLRIGPAYPLVLFEDENIRIPNPTGARHGGNTICMPRYRIKEDLSLPENRRLLEGEARSNETAARLMLAGVAALRALQIDLPARKQVRNERLIGVAEFMGRTFLTAHHAKLWHTAKQDLAAGRGDAAALREKLRTIAEAEIVNAKLTLPLVRADSRLGFEPSMHYIADEEHLRWKIAVMERILREELPRPASDGCPK